VEKLQNKLAKNPPATYRERKEQTLVLILVVLPAYCHAQREIVADSSAGQLRAVGAAFNISRRRQSVLSGPYNIQSGLGSNYTHGSHRFKTLDSMALTVASQRGVNLGHSWIFLLGTRYTVVVD